MKETTNRRRVASRRITRLSLGAASALSLACGCLQPALAGPQNPQVVNGSASFAAQGNLTTIQASNNAIINYSAFNIAAQETVRFVQPNAAARVLNRITGATPTTIAGSLLANGQVYFVNPNGIYFTPTAMINVGGIYAVAGSLANSNFLSGVDHFTNLSGAVVNQGVISGQAVHLIGNAESNAGSISADGGGVITMIAGQDVYLTTLGGRCTVQVDGSNLATPVSGKTVPDASAAPAVENTGSLSAAGGQVFLGAGDMYSLAIRNRGQISAAGGNVTLAAHDGAVVNQGQVHADGANGQAGSVLVQGPTVLEQGTVSADAATGPAGQIALVGADVLTVDPASNITARGNAAYPNGGSADLSGHSVAYAGNLDISGFGAGLAGAVTFDPADLTLSGNINGYTSPILTTNSITFGSFTNSNYTLGNLIAIAPTIYIQNGVTVSNGALVLRGNTILQGANIALTATSFVFTGTVTSDPSFAACNLTLTGASGGSASFGNNVGLPAGASPADPAYTNTALGSLNIIGVPTNFNGPLGGTTTVEAYVRTLGNQTYSQAVQINCNTTFIATNPSATVTFDAYIHSARQDQAGVPTLPGGAVDPNQGANMVVDAYDTIFNGPVSESFGSGSATASGFLYLVRSLTVNGITTIQVNPNSFPNPTNALGNNFVITTYADQVYNGPVTDQNDALLYSITGNVRFLSTLNAVGNDFDGSPNLWVYAPQGNVQFFGQVGPIGGDGTLFNNLTVQADADHDQTITINDVGTASNPSINVLGNISFNEFNGPGDLVLKAGGAFTVGGNNKITAANGNLTITAGGTASVGDLNAFDNITVTATTINFLSRTPSFLLNPDVSSRNDYALNTGLADGVDIVANGTFNFSGAFSGTKPVFGSLLASPDVSGTGTLALNGVTVVQNDPALTAAPFFSTTGDTVLGTPRVLDETIASSTSPVPDAGVLILAGPIPWVDRMVREPLVGPAARLSLAQDMSVAPRDPTSGEYVYSLQFIRLWNDFTAPAGGLSASVAQMLAGTGPEYAAVGPTFLVDAPATEGANGKPRDVEINRIRRAQALAAVDDYRALFQPESPTTAGPMDAKAAHARAVQLKELFTLAWKNYSSNAQGQPVNAAGFGKYLATLPPASPLAQDVLKMKDLLTNAHLAGFTDVEFNGIVNAVLAPLAPQTLTVPDFFQAITGTPLHRAHTPAVTARRD